MQFITRDNKPFGFCVYPPGATLGPRVLVDYEMVWIESGGAIWNYNNIEYKLFPNSVLLTKPGDTESFLWHKEKDTSHYFFHFALNRQCVPEIELLKNEEKWPLLQNLPENNVLKPMLMHAFWLMKNGNKDNDPILQSILQQVLLTFVSESFEVEQPIPDDLPPAVERVFQFIHKQWQNFPLTKPDLEMLAKKAFISQTHLCRLFNDTFDMSPMQVLMLMRLKRAAMLLVRTNYPVKQIAHLTGFENQYHFSRVFKEAYQLNPTTYRKDLQNNKTLPMSSPIVKRL